MYYGNSKRNTSEHEFIQCDLEINNLMVTTEFVIHNLNIKGYSTC